MARISKGKRYGDWVATQYKPVWFDDIGSATDGDIKLVNQETFDEVLVQHDHALRSPAWWFSYKNRKFKHKSPERVIQQLVKLSERAASDTTKIAGELLRIARELTGGSREAGKPSDMSRRQLKEFMKYFFKFYGEDGLYPIDGLTEKDVVKALKIYETKKPDYDFVVEAPDSFDREVVRDIILRWRKMAGSREAAELVRLAKELVKGVGGQRRSAYKNKYEDQYNQYTPVDFVTMDISDEEISAMPSSEYRDLEKMIWKLTYLYEGVLVHWMADKGSFSEISIMVKKGDGRKLAQHIKKMWRTMPKGHVKIRVE